MSRAQTATPEAAAERSARGDRRRTILEATVRLLAMEGLGAVTHRAVAAEADVPLAATTYYFADKEELISEALELLAAAEVERIAEGTAALGERIADPGDAAAMVVEMLLAGEGAERGLIAKYEVIVAAARRPALRSAVAQVEAALRGLAEATLRAAGAPDPAHRAPLLLAGAHGLVLEVLAEGPERLDRETFAARLRALYGLVLTAPA